MEKLLRLSLDKISLVKQKPVGEMKMETEEKLKRFHCSNIV